MVVDGGGGRAGNNERQGNTSQGGPEGVCLGGRSGACPRRDTLHYYAPSALHSPAPGAGELYKTPILTKAERFRRN